MKNRTALGGYDVQSGSHIAPGARCNNVIQLARRTPSAFAIGCTVPMQETTVHSFRASWGSLGSVPSTGCLVNPGSDVSGRRNDIASIRSSMQAGTYPSLGLFASAFEGLCGEENAPHSFSSRSALKLLQVADAVFEVAKALLLFLMCLFGGAVISGSVLCWLFIF